MAQIITEQDVLNGLEGSNRDWVYNGLDCSITSGVADVLSNRLNLDTSSQRISQFELACQSAALTMMFRGAAWNEYAAASAIKDWEAEERKLTKQINGLLGDIWDGTLQRSGKCNDGKPHQWNNAKNRAKDVRVDCLDSDACCLKCGGSRRVPSGFNPLGSAQVIHLLYGLLKLPVQHSRKGDHKVTADDEALERLKTSKHTPDEHATIVSNLLEIRRAHKQIGFLRSRISSDGRLRQSVNVGATETGRWSASKDPFREGTNFQNIADRSRHVIVADPGLWLWYADLEQAESKIVAFDSEDQGYITAHDAGDVHTFVARMVWPELPWTGDLIRDRKIADWPTPWDEMHSYRDYAKHVQHGGNIGQSAIGMARDAHIPVRQAEDCYERMYGQAFPSVRRRQREIMAQVKETGTLVNPLGRKRQFFGRLWEPATQREGMAQTQQSTVADVLNLALGRIWWVLDTAPNLFNAPRPSDPNAVWLLAQVHDAILGLIRPHDITTLQKIKELMEIPILIRGRTCTIGVEIQLGTNFRHFNPKKPETIGGLASWHVEGDRIICHNTREYLK